MHHMWFKKAICPLFQADGRRDSVSHLFESDLVLGSSTPWYQGTYGLKDQSQIPKSIDITSHIMVPNDRSNVAPLNQNRNHIIRCAII